MIRRKKLTIFTDAKDTTTVLELKKIIEGKLSPLKLIISHSCKGCSIRYSIQNVRG